MATMRTCTQTSTPKANWSPVLEDGLAELARETVRQIVEALEKEPPSPKLGFKGDASIALLLGHCGKATATSRLEHALLATSQQPLTVALFGGISGLLWLLNHLADGEEAEQVLMNFESALLDYLKISNCQQRYDLMSGLAGVGVYAAERPGEQARQIAALVLTHLEAGAVFTGAGTTWRTLPMFLNENRGRRFPEGVIDLGVAHGVPGIIGMLARFVEVNLEPERSLVLLRAAVAWLLNTVPKASPRFAASWPVDHSEKQRVAWCYGDIGVAGVLLRAGRALRSLEIQVEGLELLRRATTTLPGHKVPDAGFCHGAAGLAHVYNVAFQYTGDLQMRVEAIHWLGEVLRFKKPDFGIAGYSSLKMAGDSVRWTRDITLLSGVAGIALVLLAAIEPRFPEWQTLFLL